MDRLIRQNSQPFVLHREGERVGEIEGSKSSGVKEITFLPSVEVFVGDWLEDVRARAWLHVTDVDHSKLAHYAFIHVSYETEFTYRRQEAASTRLVSMLDEVAEAIWTLSEEKMPPEKKKKTQAMLDELRGVVRSLPAPVAAQLVGKIASHFTEVGI